MIPRATYIAHKQQYEHKRDEARALLQRAKAEGGNGTAAETRVMVYDAIIEALEGLEDARDDSPE